MSKIYAKKTLGNEKGSKVTVGRAFNKQSWDRMGKDKGGWEIISETELLKLVPSKKKAAAKPANTKVATPEEVKTPPVAPPTTKS
jgi:hypothetical protein